MATVQELLASKLTQPVDPAVPSTIPGMENHVPKMKHVFKCSIHGSSMVLKNGKRIPFIGGVYFTDVQAEIDEINEEIAKGIPNIYVDENEKEVDSSISAEQAMRNKIIAEYLNSLATNRPGADEAASQEMGLRAQNSTGVQSAASGSISMNAVPAAAIPVAKVK
jgi:hypothetical protein